MLTHITNDNGAIKRSHILAFLATALLLCVASYGYYNHVKQILIKEKQSELAGIATLKADQITQWRKERLADGETIHTNPMLDARLGEYLNGSATPVVLQEFKVWMESLRKEYGYRSAILYKTDGTQISAAIDAGDKQEKIFQTLIDRAVRKPEVFLSDLRRDEDSGTIHLDLMIPIGHTVGKNFQTRAVLLLDIDPHQFLYPLINTWPTKSKSAATVLVERSGDEVLYLNDPGHRIGPALTLRRSLTDNDSPSVRAALGQEVVFEGTDFRGVAVLAATRAIAGSPWAIVAKVGLSEIYEPIKTQAYWVALLNLLLVLGAGLAINLAWHRKEEESLHEQEQLLRATIDGLSANICVVDAEAKIIKTNRAWNSFGTENNADEKTICEGFNYLDVCRTATEAEKMDVEESAAGIRAVLAGTLSEFVKEYPCHSPYEQRWFICRVNQLHVAGAHYAVISHENITDRKLAEQSLCENQQQIEELNSTLELKVQERTAELLQERDNLKRILDTMHNGVYIVNQQLKIKYANPALLQEFGPVMDRTCHEYLHGTTGSCAWCNNREVFSGLTVHREWMSEVTGKTYSTFDTPYKNAEGEDCKLSILHDITSQKIAAQIIKDHNEELEHQVKERTRSLENANLELTVINEELEQRRIELDTALFAAKQATRVKSEFLAVMSHEIRTPLSAIIGFTDLAFETCLLPHQHDFIYKIQTAGELLLKIVNNILDFSKMEAGQVKMELIPFRLDTTLANASSIVHKNALDKDLHLLATAIPEAAVCLVGDPHLLGQIIVNLLSNAVKFTERGEVQLKTELLARHNDRMQLQFTVCDTGIGISAEHIDTLFLPFSQAETSITRRFGGTGLGLSISRQLVELMGGKIWCESVPGQGSSFCFTAWFGACQENNINQCISVCTTNSKDQWPPSDGYMASIPDTIETTDLTLILNKLRDYIKGRDGKAERYLDDYQRELSGLPDNDIRQIKKTLRNFDFVAADDVLLSIAARLGIILASDGTEDYHL